MGKEGKGWLAFGDAWNDIEMLRWAERSVCPANAKNADARASAKEVSSLTNDEAFVAEAIEKVLEEGSGGGGKAAARL